MSVGGVVGVWVFFPLTVSKERGGEREREKGEWDGGLFLDIFFPLLEGKGRREREKDKTKEKTTSKQQKIKR